MRFMKLITVKPERIVCPTCTLTYNVPTNGSIKTYKEKQCPIDNFDLLYYTGPKKNFIFCPNCYNNPPFEDMRIGSACYSCTNRTCDFSQASSSLCLCVSCNFGGKLVLDQGSGPPSWKVYCDKCTFTMSLFKDASKVSITKDTCSSCQNKLIKLKYPPGKSRLPNDLTDIKGCIWCSPDLSSIGASINNFSNSFNKMIDRSGDAISYRTGGQGRGRGRGGRGGRGGSSSGRGRGGSTNGRGRGRGESRGRGSAPRGRF